MTATRACGRQNGDYLELHNQWAVVTITFLDEGDTYLAANGRTVPRREYYVSGDTKDGDSYKRTMAEAMAYALASLAEFETGRVS